MWLARPGQPGVLLQTSSSSKTTAYIVFVVSLTTQGMRTSIHRQVWHSGCPAASAIGTVLSVICTYGHKSGTWKWWCVRPGATASQCRCVASGVTLIRNHQQVSCHHDLIVKICQGTEYSVPDSHRRLLRIFSIMCRRLDVGRLMVIWCVSLGVSGLLPPFATATRCGPAMSITYDIDWDHVVVVVVACVQITPYSVPIRST